MAYVNLASATKLHRASQINTDIGTSGLMKFYTGSPPASPDRAASTTLLASLPLSATAAVASYAVIAADILNGGTGGTDGQYNLIFTGGGGTGAAGFFTVTNGVLVSMIITANGAGYTAAPTISGFNVAGLSSAAGGAVMTGVLVFNAISGATGLAAGVAGWARVTSAGGVGVIDLDVGTTNAASVVMGNTFVTLGGSVTCSANVLIEV